MCSWLPQTPPYVSLAKSTHHASLPYDAQQPPTTPPEQLPLTPPGPCQLPCNNTHRPQAEPSNTKPTKKHTWWQRLYRQVETSWPRR